MDPGLRQRRHQLGQGRRPDGEQKSNGKTILIAAAALLGLGAVGTGWFGPDFGFGSDDQPAIGRDAPRGPVTIEAEELYEAYRDDADAARREFGGREMVVSGEFLRIVPDGYGSLDLRLNTNNPDEPLGIDVAQLALEEARQLRPGQRVTVSCQQMGSGDDIVWVQDCAIQPTDDGGAPQPTGNGGAPPPAEQTGE